MSRRAEQVDETRQRIVDAAVRLHGTVGPAATSIAAIAAEAGVTRLTVYRHFADEAALFEACSADWLSHQQPPDPSRWAAIGDPAERLRAGLADVYRFYRAGADMLYRINRDFESIPAERRDFMRARDRALTELLTEGIGGTNRRRAAVAHAVSFSTWWSLCHEQGLTDDEAIEVMSGAVFG